MHKYRPFRQWKRYLPKTLSATRTKSCPVVGCCRSSPTRMEDIPITLVDEEHGCTSTSNGSRSDCASVLPMAQGHLQMAPNSPASHISAPSLSIATTPLHAPIPLRRSPTASFLACDAPEEPQIAVDISHTSYPTYVATAYAALSHLTRYHELRSCSATTQHTQAVYPTYANSEAPAMW